MGYRENKAWRTRHPEKHRAACHRYYTNHREPRVNRRNSGQLWSPADKKLILAPNRPTDPVLARSLGRSVKAVQDMRSRLLDTRKHPPRSHHRRKPR